MSCACTYVVLAAGLGQDVAHRPSWPARRGELLRRNISQHVYTFFFCCTSRCVRQSRRRCVTRKAWFLATGEIFGGYRARGHVRHRERGGSTATCRSTHEPGVALHLIVTMLLGGEWCRQ